MQVINSITTKLIIKLLRLIYRRYYLLAVKSENEQTKKYWLQTVEHLQASVGFIIIGYKFLQD